MNHGLLRNYRGRRALTPAQASEVRKAWLGGARAADLAIAYGVHVRAIYRGIHRATQPSWIARVADFEATFQLENGYPVQVSPWVPQSKAGYPQRLREVVDKWLHDGSIGGVPSPAKTEGADLSADPDGRVDVLTAPTRNTGYQSRKPQARPSGRTGTSPVEGSRARDSGSQNPSITPVLLGAGRQRGNGRPGRASHERPTDG